MSRVLISVSCGFIGGIIAVAVGVFCLYRGLPANGYLQFSRGKDGPQTSRDVEVIEHASRPQGLYIRYKNTGSKPIEMAHFRVRAYKDGKLWAELEEAIYAETLPGMEQEGILKLRDYRDGSAAIDPSGCRIEVTALYGYVVSAKRT